MSTDVKNKATVAASGRLWKVTFEDTVSRHSYYVAYNLLDLLGRFNDHGLRSIIAIEKVLDGADVNYTYNVDK